MSIAFQNVGSFQGANGEDVLNFPTQIQFGPDGKLYVTEQFGDINVFDVSIEDGEYILTNHQEITINGEGAVSALLNHNDDGSAAGDVGGRQVTGLVVAGTAENPVLYVSSSDPRISEFFDLGLDTNSGVITQLTWTGSEWEAVDIVRGLPRSEENHSVNGLELSADGSSLYVSVGGNTNNGAPSAFFAYASEYALSGTILEIDLDDIASRPVLTDDNATQGGNSRSYVYDLPTLDDPSGVTDGVDGPWGGNDGLNQTILPADAPLSIYADGFRNAYDIVLTENGQLYTVDNGSNTDLGGDPIVVDGEATNLPNDGGEGDNEPLYLIEEGQYYGSANPTRSNQDQGWVVYDDSGNATFTFNGSIADLVPDDVNIADGFIIDPSKFTGDAGRLAESGVRVTNGESDLDLETLGSSSNGLVEYTYADAFDGALVGDLFVAQFNGNITRLDLSADGLSATEEQIPGLSGLATPLDVTVGPNGSLWVTELFGGDGMGGISVYAPTDQILPGDTDADNDGILDINDPFIRDAANGTDTLLFAGQTLTWNFAGGDDSIFPGPGGYAGGLTGQMINGTTDFEDFLQEPSDIPGLSINFDNVKLVTAAGGGTIVVENVQSGKPNGTANDASFTFHTGVDVVSNVEKFTVSLTTLNPGGDMVGDSEIGGYISDGTQSNFVKFVVSANNGGEIHLVLENDDVALTGFEFASAPGILDNITSAAPTIQFDLTVDRVADTVSLSVTYENQVGNPQTVVVPTPISLAGTNLLDTIDSQTQFEGQDSGLAIGLLASNAVANGDDTFQAVFTDLVVTADPVTTAGTVVARVNAGGPTIASIDGGPDWVADDTSGFIADAGSGDTNAFAVAAGDTTPVSAPAALFQTERSDTPGEGALTYAFNVPVNGVYEVNLFLGDGFVTTTEGRIFDVAVEGAVPTDFNDLDPVALFGVGTGGVVTTMANVTDGVLDIEFLHGSIENPLVNAIEIVALGDVAIDPIVAISATASPVVESGDVGTSTMLNFDLSFNTPPSSGVVVSYSVFVDGVQQSTGNEADLGTTGAQIMVLVPNDDEDTGTNVVEVVVDSIVSGPENVTVSGVNSATASILEDDVVTSVGNIIARVNTGGETVTAIDAGPNWFGDVADTFPFTIEEGGSGAFGFDAVDPGILIDPLVVPGVIFDTERSDGNPGDGVPLSYSFDVPQVGVYEVRLYIGNGFEGTGGVGQRVFDVSVEGSVPVAFDNIDPVAAFGGTNVGGVLSTTVSVTDGTLDIAFLHDLVDGIENPLVNGIEIVATDGVVPTSLITVAATAPTVVESGDVGSTQAAFDVSFSTPPAAAVTVAYTVFVNGAAQPSSTIELGTAGGQITFDLANDDLANGSDVVQVVIDEITVGASEDVAIGTPASATVTITEDDVDIVPTTLISVAPFDGDTVEESGDAGTTPALFVVTFDTPPATTPTIEYSVFIDGVLQQSNVSLALSNPNGTGITVQVPNDDLDNGAESVVVTIDTITGGDLAEVAIDPTGATATMSVTEDDGAAPTADENAQAAFDAAGVETPDIPFNLNNGAALISVLPGVDDIQKSNFDVDSFQVTNTGTLDIAAVYIDVSTALYGDSVFDPDGTGGEDVSKGLEINSGGETGVLDPSAYPDLHQPTGNTAPLFGQGAQGGFRGLLTVYDSNVSGGFETGETVGFSIDMDPNSLAGLANADVGGGALLGWDVGGVSGAELIGSTVTVLFTDGTSANGQLMSDGSQAGAQVLVTQNPVKPEASLTVNGVEPGETGTYGGAQFPSVIVSGDVGDTVRVVMTKGFQPVTGDTGDTVNARLAASDFAVNNAVEFQTVDVVIPAEGSIDISNEFDYTNNPNGFDFDGNDTLPLGFVASVIDPDNNDVPLGPVTTPIYLENAGGPVQTIDVGIAAFSPSVLESGDDGTTTDLTFNIGFSGTPSDAVSLTYTVLLNGNAILTDVPATIPVTGGTILVSIDNDDIPDGSDTVDVVINEVVSPVGVLVGNQGTATVSITDDDNGPIILTLVDNDTGETLAFLPENGLISPLLIAPGTSFNVIATVDEAQIDGSVESIVFDYPGFGDGGRVESGEPYAAFGDPGTPDSGEPFPAGPFTITATAFSGNSGTGAEVATRTVTIDLASPPVSSGPLAPISVGLGGDVIVDATSVFSDVDAAEGDTLTYTLVPAVDGFAIDPATGLITGAPDTLGEVVLTIVATDDFGLTAQTSLTVTATNTAPTLDDTLPPGEMTNGEEIDAFDASVFFSDPNGDALTFSISGQPAGIVINPLTGVISGTPTESGEFTTIVTATDPSGASAIGTTTISVNTAPNVAGAIGTETIGLGSSVALDVSAAFADADGDTLTYALNGAPAELSIDANGIITGTPSQIGNFTVSITATDPDGASATTEFILSVADPAEINEAPVVAAAIADADVEVGQGIVIDLADVFDDPEGAALSYTVVSSSPDSLPLSVVNGSIVGAPTQIGSYIVTVTATDPFGAVATDTFQVDVEQGNQAPVVVSQIDNASADVGEAIAIDISDSFSDPDGDPLSYSLSGAPDGITIGSNGVISGQATESGDFNVIVTATDGGSLFANNPFAITINEDDNGGGGGGGGGGGTNIIALSDGDDIFNGTQGDDEIRGLAGDDFFNGKGGDDLLIGSDGDDIIGGSDGDDTLFGGDGNDIVRGGDGADFLYGNRGQDIISGGDGDDFISAGLGDDILRGGQGADLFFFGGKFGNDILTGFEDGVDKLELAFAKNLTSFTITQVGDDTLITIDEERSVLLRDIDASVLGEDDFIF